MESSTSPPAAIAEGSSAHCNDLGADFFFALASLVPFGFLVIGGKNVSTLSVELALVKSLNLMLCSEDGKPVAM